MNRAWIPAGALAGVSVAGLIALGPLTDSMGTQVVFQESAPPVTNAAAQPNSAGSYLPVSLSVDAGRVGQTTTAGHRGGAATTVKSNPDTGLVGFRRTAKSSSATNTASANVRTTVSKPKPKKTVDHSVKTTIGSAGETPNSTDGFAGTRGGSTGNGGVSGNPGTGN